MKKEDPKRKDYIMCATKLLERLNDENLILIYKVIHRMWIKQK